MPRTRKPIEQKIIDGTFRKDRDGNKESFDEFILDEKISIPTGLFPEGKKLYKKMYQLLGVEKGIVKETDLEFLRLLCQAWGERWYLWNECILKDTDSVTGKTTKRTYKQYLKDRVFQPQFMAEIKRIEYLDNSIKKMGIEFGLTPVSRTRIFKDNSSNSTDEMEKFLTVMGV